MTNKQLFVLGTVLIFLAFTTGYFFSIFYLVREADFEHMHPDKQRAEYISHKDHMIEEMIDHRQYKCCLEEPCAYCIEKTPGHGKGATCNCLKDVVEGRHPCGECMGEILEGHGNPLLAKYFASAIAEEVGEEHKDTLKKIISEKYAYPYERQK